MQQIRKFIKANELKESNLISLYLKYGELHFFYYFFLNSNFKIFYIYLYSDTFKLIYQNVFIIEII